MIICNSTLSCSSDPLQLAPNKNTGHLTSLNKTPLTFHGASWAAAMIHPPPRHRASDWNATRLQVQEPTRLQANSFSKRGPSHNDYPRHELQPPTPCPHRRLNLAFGTNENKWLFYGQTNLFQTFIIRLIDF